MAKEDRIDTFVKEVTKMEPIEIIGLIHMFNLDVARIKEETEFKNVMAELINKFAELSSNKQKEIIKICKMANRAKTKGDKNGNRSEDTNE